MVHSVTGKILDFLSFASDQAENWPSPVHYAFQVLAFVSSFYAFIVI